MSILTNNSIAWANLQISGGWRRVAWIVSLIAIGLPLLLFASHRVSTHPDETLASWYIGMNVVQGILFLIVIPSRVHGAIRRDRQTKLIESHRLMPESSVAAVVGYIWGPNLLLLCCMACVFLLGTFIATAAKQDWTGWIALHVAAGGMSMMMCCLVAFTSQWLPKFNPALFGFVFGPMLFGSGFVVPALKVMFSPYTTGLVDLQRGDVSATHLIAFGSQILLALIFFIGAARRYRRDDLAPLGFKWGFLLLSMWVGLTLVSLLGDRVQVFGNVYSDELVGLSFVIGVATSMFLAIGPVVSAGQAATRWRERRAIDAYLVEPQPIALLLAAAFVLLLLMTLLIGAPGEVGPLAGFSFSREPSDLMHIAMTAMVIAVFAVSVVMLSHAAGRMKLVPAFLIVPWLAILWAGLPILDASTALLQGQIESFPRALSGASPPVSVGMIWRGDLPTALVGIVAQIATLPLMWAMWMGVTRMRTRSKQDVPA